MGRKTKKKVIAELKAKHIKFDENMKYNDLYKLLKMQPKKKKPEEHSKLLRQEAEDFIKDTDLIERAKKIGFTDEQIATYTDPEKLKMACDRLKPQVTPQPKKRQIFKPFKDKPKGKKARATFETTISVKRAQAVIRAGYDNMILGDFLRKEKIRPESVQKVTIIRNYVPDKREILTSKIIVDYLRKG